ncbi:MAG: right-handed parallel beta-helix repeat-containing protein [Paludibacter sp.]|nr:right-handed parallel beta-helix repeat-containing protein [Paludibacter sp.]
MKAKSLLLFGVLCLSSYLSAATITVTTSDLTGTGSFTEAFTAAVDGDVINFNFDGTEINFTDAFTMKSITIDGTNAFNDQPVTLKQTTASKGYFTLASGITATFQNLIFDGTETSTLGNTAITAANGSTITIDNCVFKNINAQANNGGAARIQGVATVSNTGFFGNTTAGSYGGGALCIYNAANVTIDKCSFIGNTSNANGNSGGGAIVARGTKTTTCDVTITNSTFANNVSGKTGGALLSSVQSSSAYLVDVKAINCTFAGNQGDGAISALTTANGIANVYLVNSLVVNNVNAAADAYSDLLETLGSTEGTAVLIEPHNVIYSVASSTIVTTDRNCIQVIDPSTADLFKETETFATDKIRPVLTQVDNDSIAMISSTSIARNAGISTLSGYTIPTTDQLGYARPATPSVGAVEYNSLTTFENTYFDETDKVGFVQKGSEITFTGLSGESEVFVYGLTGRLLQKSMVSNNATISLQNIKDNLVLVKVQNQSFKIILK